MEEKIDIASILKLALLGRGAYGNCSNEEKITLLHCACRNGLLHDVRFLVSEKCDLNAPTIDRGETPILLAARGWECWHRRIVEFLVDSGACLSNFDRDGQTVLHHASEKGWLDVFKTILERNEVNINLENLGGSTPLLLASRNVRKEIVDLLLHSGADLNCQDRGGQSVLHYAASWGWPNVVEKCTEVYPDLSVLNDHSKTPLMIACCKERTEIMKLLLKAGADCNVRNKFHKTALTCALEHGIIVVDVFNLLIENGAFLERTDHILILNSSFLKGHILTDVGLCTQLIINKFNNKDLPALYQLPGCIGKLPSIESLKIANKRSVPQQIKKAVEGEMEAKKCCDVMAVRPMVLQMLAVQALIKHHSTLKRSATQNLDNKNVPVKKSRIV